MNLAAPLPLSAEMTRSVLFAILAAPHVSASVGPWKVIEMRSDDSQLKNVFRAVAEATTTHQPTRRAPDTCDDLLDEIIAFENIEAAVSRLSSFIPVGLLRLEDECKKLLANRQIAEIDQLIARLVHPYPEIVEREELIHRLAQLKSAKAHFEDMIKTSPFRLHRVPENIFTGIKLHIIDLFLPLLKKECSPDELFDIYNAFGRYLIARFGLGDVHAHAFKGAIEQAYAELFTERSKLESGSPTMQQFENIDSVREDIRSLTNYRSELEEKLKILA
jgi:hypothetical protein